MWPSQPVVPLSTNHLSVPVARLHNEESVQGVGSCNSLLLTMVPSFSPKRLFRVSRRPLAPEESTVMNGMVLQGPAQDFGFELKILGFCYFYKGRARSHSPPNQLIGYSTHRLIEDCDEIQLQVLGSHESPPQCRTADVAGSAPLSPFMYLQHTCLYSKQALHTQI